MLAKHHAAIGEAGASRAAPAARAPVPLMRGLGGAKLLPTAAAMGGVQATALQQQHFGAHLLCSSRRRPACASAAVEEPETSSSTSPYASVEYGYSTVQGVRDNMEDEVEIHFNEEGQYLYAAVFDGHGGEAAAQWLAKELHKRVHNCFMGDRPSDASFEANDEGPRHVVTPAHLITSFVDTDKELIRHLQQLGSEEVAQAGSTATVAVLKDNRLVVANVGDSQAVLSRKGAAVAIAHQHRVYGTGPDMQAETERILQTGGWVDDGRVCGVLAVSRAFGDYEFKGAGLPRLLQTGIDRGFWDSSFANQQSFTSDPVIVVPDVTETELKEDDEFLVVASDGLWDVMQPREVVAWARKEFKLKRTAEQVAQSLTDIALKRYSTDNVAVVVVDLMGAEYWQQKPKKVERKPLLGGFFASGKK